TPAIRRASTAAGRAASAAGSRSSNARWTCASSNPGISVRPWQSITRASFGPAGPLEAPIRRIRPSSTTIRRFGCGSRPVQSSRVACSKTTLTARLVYLRTNVGQEEVGRVGEQETEEESPGHGGGRIEPPADRQSFREVVQAEPGGDHHRQRPGGRRRRVLGSSEESGIEVDQAEEPDPNAGGKDHDQREECAIAVAHGGEAGLDGRRGMAENVPEQEDQDTRGDGIEQALDRL